jgi:glycerol kinase
MGYIGSIDQGTTSSRFIIFDEKGKIVASAAKEFRQIFPQPGWVEHDPNEIVESVKYCISEALHSGGIDPAEIVALGITNQRETIVAWDVNSKSALANAIVWQDLRGEAFLESLSEREKEVIIKQTGLVISPYFSGSKVAWLSNNSPAVKAAAAAKTLRIGTIDSWLIYNLTLATSGSNTPEVHATDLTNASRTLLFDIEKLAWSPELLNIFKVDRSALPEVKPSNAFFGDTTAWGIFPKPIPIHGSIGDQQAAMVGQMAIAPGDNKTTYGTGNFALVNTGKKIIRSQKGLLTTICYQFAGEDPVYALEGSVAVSGSAISWLRDQLGIINSASEVEALANQVSSSDGVYFVPAFAGLFAPHWDSSARGLIIGLTRASNKAHIARAALEAIAYQTREILDLMSEESGISLSQMRVDGGATANATLMQIQADVSGSIVIRPEVIETTALGAAYCAGLGVGYWQSFAEISHNWVESMRWIPENGSRLRSEGWEKWKSAISRSLHWME